ncbi:hypothetical protein IFM89_025859 [Coptis chinensis]|uniref:RNase H type-1 domain-containing protein n=1 Tax=Coptis chinensis TaxID=261450 RepID=A0A835HVK2_9MAGN|nr:hypothetical protein IFM89_025859 [Coptis chinensis]
MVIPCYWIKPDEGIAKLDADGAVNNRGAGFGGIIHDSNGDMIAAYIGSSLHNSILFQELTSIHQGLSTCLRIGISKVLVASDYLRAIHAITKIEEPPWQMWI